MNILIGIGIFLGIIFIVIPAWLVVFVALAARDRHQATTIPEGEIQFVVSGGKDAELKGILLNVAGYHLDGELIVKNGYKVDTTTGDIVRGDDDDCVDTGNYAMVLPDKPSHIITPQDFINWIKVYLWEEFGIRWVSWFYPMVRVHRFKVSKDKMKNQTDLDGKPIGQWIQRDEGEVTSLYWRFIRPTLVTDVELPKDGAKINVIVYGTYQVVNPVNLVFLYKGKFATHIDAAVSNLVNNFCQTYRIQVTDDKGAISKEPLSYETFMAMPRGKGSDIAKCLDMLDGMQDDTHNMSADEKAYYIGLQPTNILKEYGLRVDTAYIQSWGLTTDSVGLQQAKQKVGEAKYRLQEAEQEAQTKTLLRTAPIEAMVDLGVNATLAAQLSIADDMEQKKVDQMGKVPSSIHTLILGDSGAKPSILVGDDGGNKGSRPKTPPKKS